jgi:hypothetical protein
MAIRKKIKFEGKNEDNQLVSLEVRQPTQAQSMDATILYNKKFKEYVDKGLILNAKLDKVMKEQGIWDDVKDQEYRELIIDLQDKIKLLKKGGKLSEARKLAIDIKIARNKLYLMRAERTEFEKVTVESLAEQDKFENLVIVCTVYADNGNPVWKNVDAYKNDQSEVSYKAANHMMELLYNLDANYENNLPENSFLRKYNLLNDKGELTDKAGNLVDVDMKPVKPEDEVEEVEVEATYEDDLDNVEVNNASNVNNVDNSDILNNISTKEKEDLTKQLKEITSDVEQMLNSAETPQESPVDAPKPNNDVEVAPAVDVPAESNVEAPEAP